MIGQNLRKPRNFCPLKLFSYTVVQQVSKASSIRPPKKTCLIVVKDFTNQMSAIIKILYVINVRKRAT